MDSQYPYFSWKDLLSTAINSDSALLYPFAFDFREQVATYQAAGVSFSLQDCYTHSEPFKVKLVAIRSDSSLQIELHYDTTIFDRRDMQRVARQFTTLLESAIKQPEARISELNMLSTLEKEQLLVELNQTQSDYPRNLCLHQLFEQQVVATPDAIAVYDNEKQLTYWELDSWANRVARYLQDLGVRSEMLVGLCLPHSIELVVCTLGILKAGGAYVPLDPTSPTKRLASIAADAHLSILLTTDTLLDVLHGLEHVISLNTAWATLARYSGERVSPSTVAAANLAYVIYTSGSTGQPKGVMISHQGLVHYVHWACTFYEIAAGSGMFLHSSIAFDLTVTSLFSPLVVGRSVWMDAEDASVDALANTLRTKPDFSAVKLTPAHLELLNQSLTPSDLVGTTRTLIVGGEALRGESLTGWHEHVPEVRLINEYGPTETVVGCCIYEVPRQGPMQRNVPIGRPIANTQIYLLDQYMQPVPLGMVAEIYIGGVGLGRGYLHRAHLTAESFVPHPFSSEPGARLYKTGDLARYVSADGDLEYVGRIDHQIKIRGYRVELGEIEVALHAHSSVQEAVVVLRADAEREKFLVAYVVAQPGAHPGREELRSWLGNHVPEYMVPTWVVLLEGLPLTPNGKLDRKALPAPDTSSLRDGIVRGPRTPLEEVVTMIWADLLHLSPSQLSIHDSFFSLGGHSLLATRLLARLRQRVQVELSLRQFFEAPTIADQVSQIEMLLRGNQQSLPAIGIAPRTRPLPLSFAQERLWFLQQLEPLSIAYHIPMALQLRGPLNVEALEWSLQALIKRQESLRTTFTSHEGQPIQIIADSIPMVIPVIDLGELTLPERDKQILSLYQQISQALFDLAHGPLLRLYLLRLEEQDQTFIMNLHHIITDGWSMGILVRELSALYQGQVQGTPLSLPVLPIQYADYALWQRQWLQGEVLEQQLDYWKQQVAGTPALLVLPTDHPRPAVQTFSGTSQTRWLSLEMLQQVQQLSQQEGVTLFMTLLAAFQVLLMRYSGQTDIVVGTPIANRTRVETEGLIGFFVNTLVLRSNLSNQFSFRDLLAQVREVTLQAYAHQDVPFEQIVEAIQVERSLSYSPLFQVLFVLQNTPRVTLNLAGLTWEQEEMEQTTTKFDLSLILQEEAHGLRMGIEYNTALFEVNTIARMLDHWQVLLHAIVADPAQCIATLPILTPTEHELILVEWNDTAHSFHEQLLLHERFEQQVERTPDAIAVVFEEQQLTYIELNVLSNRLAFDLQARGVGPEVLVGVCLERSHELIVALFAILKAGGVYVPFDITYPMERLAFLFSDADVRLVLTQSQLVPLLTRYDQQTLLVLPDRGNLLPVVTANCTSKVQPDNQAHMIYTSGSTGKPKGVMNTHTGIRNRLLWMMQTYQLGVPDRVVQKTPMSFDISLWELFLPLITGATLVFAEPGGHQDPHYLKELIREQAITTIHLCPRCYTSS